MQRDPLIRRAWKRNLQRMAGLLTFASVVCLIGGGPAHASTASPGPSNSNFWTVYHHDPAGTGVAESVSAVDTSARAWTSPDLDGEIYGEPLIFGQRIYVATEKDTVYALSSSTGAVVW